MFLVLSLLCALVCAQHPEDVQVFVELLTDQSIQQSQPCLSDSKLQVNLNPSAELQSVIQSHVAQPQELLRSLMFNAAQPSESSVFQNLAACVLRNGQLRRTLRQGSFLNWLWNEIFHHAGVLSSKSLRNLAKAMGTALPRSLMWVNSASGAKYDDSFNLLHQAVSGHRHAVHKLSSKLLSRVLAQDFIDAMETLRSNLAKDPLLPRQLQQPIAEATQAMLYTRTVPWNSPNESVMNDEDSAAGMTTTQKNIMRISNAVSWTALSFLLSAFAVHAASQAGQPPTALLQHLLAGRDVLGRTPLHALVESNSALMYESLQQTLLDVGQFASSDGTSGVCSVYLRDIFGYTPLELAEASGKTASERALRYWLATLHEYNVTCSAENTYDNSSMPPGYGSAVPRVAAEVTAAGDVALTSPGTETGGWGDPLYVQPLSQHAIHYVRINATSECDIDVVDSDITGQEFLYGYWLAHKPVLIRGAAVGWDTDGLWTRSRFLKSHGKEVWPVGLMPHAKYVKARKMSIRDFVVRMQDCTPNSTDAKCEAFQHGIAPYIFDIITDEARYAKEVKRLPLLNISVNAYQSQKIAPGDTTTTGLVGASSRTPLPLFHASKPQLYIGGAGSGAAIHYHFDAYNVLMYGEKQWILQPPAIAEHSTLPIQHYIVHVLPNLPEHRRPLQCRQRAGDVLFVPRDWSHGILNLQTVVGYGVEFNSMMDRSY